MEGATVPLDVQTSAAGATFVVVAAAALQLRCTAVRIHNNTGTTLEVKRDDNAVGYVPVYDKDRMLFWVSDPARLSIRRVDQSNTQVTAKAEVLSF